jgi:hypothetical protein
MDSQIIVIHSTAPDKPAWGSTCNGCGVCCLAEPCPAGRVFTLRWRGACRLLTWDSSERRYRCGLMAAGSIRAVRPAWLARWIERRARRWIAAGSGCDSDALVDG